MEWKLAEAKNRFSELVNRAIDDGPQRVTRRGDVVIVISEADYRRLQGTRPSLVEYILNGPDLSELDLTRDRSLMREIEL